VRESAAPDEVVRLEDGSVRLDVSALAVGERVRVIVGDTEIDARAGSFEATARSGTLAAVQVVAGSVDVRSVQQPHAVIIAGQRWDMNVEAERDTFIHDGAEPPPSSARPAPRSRVDDPPAPEQPAITTPPTPALPPPIAGSGMAQLFERGFQQLKAGRPNDALSTFDDALARHPHDPLAEDVAFWRGVALARLGRAELAMSALTDFIARFPQSPRAGEASAMVGWMLFEAGRYEDAEQRFRAATSDRATPVRESAQRGLAALSAKRANTSR
jgi:TolA-binding protein